MKNKTYLLTLILFLLFFNGSILLISIVNLKTNLDSTRENCLREHSFITIALTKDLTALESRGIEAGSALQVLFDSYVHYYGKQNVYMELVQNGQTLYSSLPEGQELKGKPELPAAGKRIISTLPSQDRKYIGVVGVLPAPHDSIVLSYYYDLSALTAAWKRMTSLLFLAGLVISSLLAVCLILLLNRLFKPLQHISEASKSIAQGNYANRIPVRGNDELSEMATSFNNMAEAIENHIARLADAAEQKQRFIDNFAHELRTPLTSIYGYAEYLQKASISEEDKLEATGFIMSESRRLQNIAYVLLDLASLRSSEIVFAPVDIAELFQNIIDTLIRKAEEKQVTISFACGFDVLNGDRDLLQSLMVNLTDNAIKACEPGGSINITAYAENGRKIIEVRDNGRGMTREQLAHIKEPFYRVDKARSRAEGGVGLGLSICEQIAARHGAELKFDSQPGLGTITKVIFTSL
ncbi:MAG TPA: HAMP domain-containing sensor histidine kinase [Syntrophomonadaceae bacterium]|nr:HAMP domain-containing sensor histidine kinase [Syntrophomonadaceae bacterium]HQE24255.1 HAMP domain-containing sensor histidine kinase [Syntrophomonadaceae bacterium]